MAAELDNSAGNTAEQAQENAVDQQQSTENSLELLSLNSKTIDLDQVRANLGKKESTSEIDTVEDREAMDPGSAAELDVSQTNAFVKLARDGKAEQNVDLHDKVVENIADVLHYNVVKNIE